MATKKIMITGGLGYLGSHAVVAFEQAGYTTVIVDNCSNTSADVLDAIQKILGYKPSFYKEDIRNKKALDAIFASENIAGVIHFAALKAVGESCEKAALYFDNNISGSITLCTSMHEHNVRLLVFSSSCTVYGNPKTIPVNESTPFGETTNPYGTTKQLMEKILTDFATFSGFSVINLRYFNPIGAHPSGYLGETPPAVPPNLLPYIFKVLKKEIPALTIFGNDYATRDGTCIRDFIDVNDLIAAHLKAYQFLENKKETGRSMAVNLGNGVGTTVLEMIHAVEKVTKKEVPFVLGPRRQGDIPAIYADSHFAEELFGWKTTTPLAESIKTMMQFYGIY